MFTEKNNTYWKEFSKEINGDFIEREYWHSAKAIYSYKGFKTIFSHYTHYTVSGRSSIETFVTTIHCIFRCNTDINLKLEEDTFINKVLNTFNSNKIQIINEHIKDKFIVCSNSNNIVKLFNELFCKELILSECKRLYIDNYDGIWGDKLEENLLEVATYFDSSNMQFSELLKVKDFFLKTIDVLLDKYDIKPI